MLIARLANQCLTETVQPNPERVPVPVHNTGCCITMSVLAIHRTADTATWQRERPQCPVVPSAPTEVRRGPSLRASRCGRSQRIGREQVERRVLHQAARRRASPGTRAGARARRTPRATGGVSDEETGDRFFDFRVADIAMGSGLFLVAAIDHIEKAFSGCLARRKLPVVIAELATLRAAAITALGSLSEQVEIEDLNVCDGNHVRTFPRNRQTNRYSADTNRPVGNGQAALRPDLAVRSRGRES